MNLGSVCQTTAKGPEHVAMVLLRCTVELHLVFLGLSRWLGPEQVLIFLYQPLHTCLVSWELPIPELFCICSGFVLYFFINMCNTFYSFLAHSGMKITWFLRSGRTPLNSVWWHQCMWEDKQDLCRNGDICYMGCLFNVPGTLTVHLFSQTALVDWGFVKAD